MALLHLHKVFVPSAITVTDDRLCQIQVFPIRTEKECQFFSLSTPISVGFTPDMPKSYQPHDTVLLTRYAVSMLVVGKSLSIKLRLR